MPDLIQVLTAIDSQAAAEAIASTLVERELAACVHVAGPISSTYRWRGTVERAAEWICVVKTRSDRFDAVASAIRELHSYELPGIMAIPVEVATADYGVWWRQNSSPDAP